MPPLSIMIKPASSRCTMRCTYCFYRDVAAHRERADYGLMTGDTLERLVRRAFAYADGQVAFSFQGGEPTLAGLAFYEQLMRLQRKYNARGIPVHNAIQTNGLAIDDDFAAFFAKHGFLVGLSIDGGRETHDALRTDASGAGTWDRTQKTAALLAKHGVDFNALCVVTAQVAARPRQTFEALAPFGFVQFIPCLDGFGEPPDACSLTPALYADFLKTAFDLYEQAIQRGRPVSVRDFDNYIQMLAGYPPEHCGMGGRCRQYFLIEADGSVYPCDFYVLDEWRLGNIHADSFFRLAQADRSRAFIEASVPLAPECGECRWLSLCRGGCRREREPIVKGHPTPHRLCAAYQSFFDYAHSRMQALCVQLLGK